MIPVSQVLNPKFHQPTFQKAQVIPVVSPTCYLHKYF